MRQHFLAAILARDMHHACGIDLRPAQLKDPRSCKSLASCLTDRFESAATVVTGRTHPTLTTRRIPIRTRLGSLRPDPNPTTVSASPVKQSGEYSKVFAFRLQKSHEYSKVFSSLFQKVMNIRSFSLVHYQNVVNIQRFFVSPLGF